MGYKDYPTKRPVIEEEIICPHCGKVMQLLPKKNWLKRQVEHNPYENCYGLGEGDIEPDLDEIWTSNDAVETFKCNDDDIKYIPYSYEWIFPKNYIKTITQKQENYIEYLFCKGTSLHAIDCDYPRFNFPYITSLELASKWISAHVDVVNQAKNDDELRDKVMHEIYNIDLEECNAWNNYHGKSYTTLAFKDMDQFKKVANLNFVPRIIIDWKEKTCTISYSLEVSTDFANTPTILQGYFGIVNYYCDLVREIILNVYNINKGENR